MNALIEQHPNLPVVIVSTADDAMIIQNALNAGAMAESLSRLPLADTAKVMASISKVIQTEIDESARYSMANFTGKNLAKNSQYKPVLQKLIRTEPSKRVRQIRGDALAIKSGIQ